MTTTVVKTIGSGGDFATPQLWADSLTGLDLVAADQIQQGQCFNQEFTAAGNVLVFNGVSITTDATRYVELTAAPGASFRDNASVRTNPLYYNASNGAALRNTGTAGYVVYMASAFFLHITNLQLAADAGSTAGFFISQSSANVTIDGCIVSGTDSFEAEIYSVILVRNSAFVVINPVFARMVRFSDSTGVVNLDFCTIVAPAGTSVANVVEYANATATANYKNCAFFGATTALASGAGSATLTYTTCAMDLGSPPSGVTGNLTYANQFVSTTNDFREKAGADLQGVGTADATNGATDISGLARPQGSNSWDIGAWELQVSAPETLMGAIVI